MEYKHITDKFKVESLKPCSTGNGFMVGLVNRSAKLYYCWVNPLGLKHELTEGCFYDCELTIRYEKGVNNNVSCFLEKVTSDYCLYYHSKRSIH